MRRRTIPLLAPSAVTPRIQSLSLPIVAEMPDGGFVLPVIALPLRHQATPEPDAIYLRPVPGPKAVEYLNDMTGSGARWPTPPSGNPSGKPVPSVTPTPTYDDEVYPVLPGKKKRKVPAFQLSSGRQGVYEGDVKDGTSRHQDLPPVLPDPPADQSQSESQSHTRAKVDDESTESESTSPVSEAIERTQSTEWKSQRKFKSTATQRCEFRKLQFLRRKAALITLFLDATSAIKSYWKDEKSSTAVNMSKSLLAKLPEVDAFEKLLPALEDVGVGEWPADKSSWRKGTDVVDEGDEDEEAEAGVPIRRLGVWKAKFAKRQKIRAERKEVVRGGWAPEGSFEFERSSKAGNVAREGAKARAALQRLANELRHILLTVKPQTATLTDQSGKDGGSPHRTKRKTAKSQVSDNAPPPASASAPAPSAAQSGDAAAGTKPASDVTKGGEQLERVGSGSKDGSEVGSGTGAKKKPKKKKRSVLANQSNPHHVDNYRPTRTVTSAGDPNEPYPHHSSLLFPPSMGFLSARPNGTRVRASEEDYICSFCEYDLFYGSEKLRRAAIRRRKREIKRKENIKNKAKNVAEGKGKLNEESEYDDEGDDEECEDQGYGKCSCGRALGPHGDKEHHLKPPDPDPDPHPHIHADPPPTPLPGVADTAGLVSRASTPSID